MRWRTEALGDRFQSNSEKAALAGLRLNGHCGAYCIGLELLMHINILAPGDDSHAIVVQKAIQAKGANATIVDTRKVDFSLSSSVEFGGEVGLSVLATSDGEHIPWADVIWLRRPLLAPWKAIRDARDVEIYWQQDSLLLALAETAKMAANPIATAIQMESKLRGLQAAQSAGFAVPPTLFTADPKAVCAFFAENHGEVVFKSHRPQPSGTGRSSGTAQLTQNALNNSEAIRRQPGIYQRKLDIHYELRVLVLGRTLRAVKVVNRSRFIDSRLMLGCGNEVSAVEVPRHLAQRCIDLVHDAGLVSASIDVACVPNGDYVFLDLNPAGQFLWMEYYCPEVDVLDAFVRFLISGSPDFEEGATTKHRVRLSDFDA